ncbi:MAG: hypothetical protein IJP04_01620, partial [Clostridia bacterium]|nr:hypothetical protein [Clostridia bacterium]
PLRRSPQKVDSGGEFQNNFSPCSPFVENSTYFPLLFYYNHPVNFKQEMEENKNDQKNYSY